MRMRMAQMENSGLFSGDRRSVHIGSVSSLTSALGRVWYDDDENQDDVPDRSNLSSMMWLKGFQYYPPSCYAASQTMILVDLHYIYDKLQPYNGQLCCEQENLSCQLLTFL